MVVAPDALGVTYIVSPSATGIRVKTLFADEGSARTSVLVPCDDVKFVTVRLGFDDTTAVPFVT